MHLLPLILYACAAGAYLAHFAGRDRSIGRLATGLLGGAVLSHTFIIGMQTVQVGHAPLVGTTAAVSAFVWLLGLAYLYVELTTDERAMGVLVTALLAVLYVIPALDPGVSPRPSVLQSPLFTIHVLAMLFAYASFALAGVLGIVFGSRPPAVSELGRLTAFRQVAFFAPALAAATAAFHAVWLVRLPSEANADTTASAGRR